MGREEIRNNTKIEKNVTLYNTKNVVYHASVYNLHQENFDE